jgi:SAM-dependent methyltransferase
MTRMEQAAMMEWTGERFLPYIDPKVCGAWIHYEHLHRYAYASLYARGRKVLDLASGEGYGSHMLSETASHVVGVERDGGSVEHARGKYVRKNLEFIQGSILDIPLEGKELFDLIVCFEAIEHVGDHERLLSEVKRLLKRDGLFIVSTPNKVKYTDENGINNPFHVHELYMDELKSLLGKYFASITLMGQKVFAGSTIWRLAVPGDRGMYRGFVIDRPESIFKFESPEIMSPKYYIVIASDMSPGDLGTMDSVLIDNSNALIKTADNPTEALRRATALAEELGREVRYLQRMQSPVMLMLMRCKRGLMRAADRLRKRPEGAEK